MYLTCADAQSMLDSVRALLTRLAATIAVLGLVPGTATALCAGWEPSAEARRACCAAGLCGNDHRGSPTARGGLVISQVEADSCCAESESGQQSASPSLVTAPLPVPDTGSVLLASPPLPTYSVVRWAAPPPTDHVPKHIRVSVFLI